MCNTEDQKVIFINRGSWAMPLLNINTNFCSQNQRNQLNPELEFENGEYHHNGSLQLVLLAHSIKAWQGEKCLWHLSVLPDIGIGPEVLKRHFILGNLKYHTSRIF